MQRLSTHQLSESEEEELVTSEEEESVTSEVEEEEEEEIMPRRLSRRNAASNATKQTLDIALGALINGFTTAFSNSFLTFTRQLNDLSVVLSSSLPVEPAPRHRRNALPPPPPRRRPRRVRSAPPAVLNAGRRRRRNAPKSDARQTAAFKARNKRRRFTPNLNRARPSNTAPPPPPPPPPPPSPAPAQKSAPSSSFVLPPDPVGSPEDIHSPLSMPILM